ncbi:class I SAM-dependent methyltransferase [Pseudomonas viridiflava]|uniref:Class I SAM-dependent methyltransferase n=1 Tax=Pseudomonas viridiflava TaxID=33069 RepID=A0ABU7N749_PSEVI|nr:class I SAM-dependent methyltransferase [Pseudomonas viridiflava]MEE4040651.1 class I SAM-dependent methyltransferase [Pseudomonas viridiflava]MEE4060969.1 class I SAM-dependent methyltransferase [Pseudomonas viridiflava]MEE4170546.1 class I SAM-dependent methyltransferase [Pseudomonas viridiflava]
MEHEDKAWTDYREKFSELYDDSNYASPLQSFVMRASHKLVEKEYGQGTHFKKVLEIGAGTGEHVKFVCHEYDEYTLSDMDEKTLEVAKGKLLTMQRGNLKFERQEGSELNYSDDTFDRLIATHVLEHIYQPHLALKEWSRVIKDGGVLSILIPTDPGLAWRLGRHLGPRKNAIAQGIAYDYVMAREHVNACNNLIAILRHYFPVAKEAWWPFPVPSIDLNLFFSFHAIVRKKGSSE